MTATKENFNREDLRSRLTPEQYRITQQESDSFDAASAAGDS
jgi:hypothetical protein